MTYKLIKYLILGGLAIVTFYHNLPIGDYCSGLVELIIFIFLVSLFLLVIMVFLTIDLMKKFKRNESFDFVPIVILVIFLIGNSLLLKSESDKFWTDKEFVGIVEVENLKSAQLILYSNKSFNIKIAYADWSCTFQGDYSIKDDILKLERDNIEDETNNIFTKEYKILISDSLLIPLKNGNEIIQIRKIRQ
jgi:hypothetical protein